MSIVARFIRIAVSVREFLAPTYRPERHYMRGPGPASTRAKIPDRKELSAEPVHM